jgi:F-type H+-transporting ATPase subunit b
MQLDWFTLFAQIINFLILVALLKHFLYGRIIEVMDEREQRITSRLTQAEEKRKQAEEEAETYRNKTKELEQQRRETLEQAEHDAEARRKELVANAREAVEHQKAEWKKSLEREQEEFLRDLQQTTGEQVYAVTRRVIRDLAHDELERQIVRIFLERLHSLSDEERDRLRAIVRQPQETVQVRSAFEMPEDLRQQIRTTLADLAADQTPELEFVRSDDLLGGVELSANGQKISWSIRSYLTELEQQWREKLGEISTQEQAEGAT